MLTELSTTVTSIERDGFALLKSAVSPHQIDALIDAVESIRRDHTTPGLRNLLGKSETIRKFAYGNPMIELATTILCAEPKAVRAILFDKTPASNWYVTWHQDLSIPVKEKREIEGYGPWSVKDDVIHVQPPAQILERMISFRVHLDPCSAENGAIKFIPGSHRSGFLEAADISQLRDNGNVLICPADRGDIIIMRPLILHSSSTSQSPDHRRVLHVEYAGVDLPRGLEWAAA